MYLALARKYRPQRFSELIGQASICKTIQNSIAMNKVYPAMIFSGTKGVGKTSAARILAKALNCEKGPAIEPCNECPTCLAITEDGSADYLEIDGASNNGVDDIRHLRETVKYRPLKNRYRMVIIDEVHMLSVAAWNALLKTIEEPPEHTVFIMATTDFHKIPATIVSRCQHFEFKRIPHEVIKRVLQDISAKEEVKISDYGLYLIARAAEGSLRDAKKIFDQAIAISSGDVKDADVIAILGIIEEEIFIRLTRCVTERDRRGIILQVNDLLERGIDLRFFYGEYLKFVRDLIVIKSIEDSDRLHNLNPENLPEIREILKNISDVELLRNFNALKDAEMMMRNTENPSIVLEFLFLKLSYFPALVSIEEIIRSIRSGPPAVAPAIEPAGTKAAPPADSPAQPAPGGRATAAKTEPGDGENLIAGLRTRISQENPRMASALNAALIQLDEHGLRIEVGRNFESACKMMKEQQAWLSGVASELAGRPVAVDLALADRAIETDEEKAIQAIKQDQKISGLRTAVKGKLISIESIRGGKDE
jgi:DNA polymerase III subunit gamma/tau